MQRTVVRAKASKTKPQAGQENFQQGRPDKPQPRGLANAGQRSGNTVLQGYPVTYGK